MGLFAPFWAVFILGFGDSFSAVGFAIGLKTLAHSLAACGAGALSDKLGRKPVVIVGRLASSLVICCYPMANSLLHLYILQALFGVAAAADSTATFSFLGDLTQKASRGRSVGLLYAVTGAVDALAMMLGGVAVEQFGIEAIFYVVGTFFLASLLLLLPIQERRA